MFVLPALGAFNGLRLAAIGRTINADRGALPAALRRGLRDPRLWVSLQTRLGIVLGIVFLMTVKPGLGVSLLAMAAAAGLGLASSLPAWSRSQVNDAVESPG
jgi:hypothetical protein